jgi:outer membrane receptor protein involved in Fe transport
MGDAFGVVAGLESVTDFVDSSASDALAGTGFLPVDRARGNFSSGSTYTTLGAFAYADVPVLTWIGGTWSMTAGARGTWVQAEAPDVPGLGDVRYSDWGIVGTAGSRWTLSNQWNVHLNYAQGFRLPNLQETTVLGDTGKNFEVPNGELRPEMSHSGELGVRWARPGVQLTTSYSLSLIADVIVRADATFEGASTIDGAPVKQRVNSDEAIYHALDGGISLGPWERTTVFARWMWVQGDVKSADGSREPARRVPPLQGRAGATYHAFGDQLHVTVFADWAAAQTRLSSGDKEDLRICEDSSALGTVLVDCQGTAGWIDPGVQLNWFLDPKLQLNASVRNLSDSLYRHHGSGIDAPGFHARVGLVGRL